MKPHNPPKLKLPPLMIEMQKDREEMEKRKDITNFIKSNLLLNKEFYKLFMDIHGKSIELERLIDVPPRYISINYEKGTFTTPIPNNIYDRGEIEKEYKSLLKGIGRQLGIEVVSPEKYSELIQFHYEEGNKKIIEQIGLLSEEIQDILSGFEKEFDIELEVLSLETIYVCGKCHKIIAKSKFRKTRCICGNEIDKISHTYQKSIANFGKELRKFISNNYWFEWGVEYLFRKMDFNTLCGYNVLGAKTGAWRTGKPE